MIIRVDCWQELGIPFHVKGCSELAAERRAALLSLFHVDHVHKTLAAQVAGEPCLQHADQVACPQHACDLLVMGTPCPPFSNMRAKRNSEGCVQHPLYDVTFKDATAMIATGLHRACILEQVQGFGRAEPNQRETPLQRQGRQCVSGATA